MLPADLGLAFLAGLISCGSACVLPLLPTYMAYLGGAAAGEPAARLRQPALMGRAVLFVAGFTTAFVGLGAAAGQLGAGLAIYRPALAWVSGAVLIVLGAALLGGVPWLVRERRLHIAHRLPRAPWAAYLVGLVFAAGWTPCVGPILAAVLMEAASRATAGQGALLLTAYSAGMGVLFLAAAAFLAPVAALIGRVRGAYRVLNAVAAAVLIGIGVLTMTNRLTVLNSLSPSLAPVQGTATLSTRPASAGAGPLVGHPVPAVTVRALGGGSLSLGSLRGRPAVVTFWATWCVPCQEELPLFSDAYRAHRDQRLALVAIDYQEARGPVETFWRRLALEPDPYLDEDGRAARSFGVGPAQTGLPVTVLVDRRGTVTAVLPGQVDAHLFQSKLGEILRD